MTLVIDNLKPDYLTDAIRLGAVVTYEPDDPTLIHACFTNCRAYVRDQYVKIRDQNHNVMILDKFEFSKMTIF